ncbi:DUF2066 domain-containing protein [Luteimonas abyssi]|uniref:DUF2066 domain-containing protein n=1 Tax=Luteimonas abyssi TaxID=1247514 RepID=UPI000737CF1A|nr:DUF2066 domain-containing protein [Luteimonas abyssi]
MTGLLLALLLAAPVQAQRMEGDTARAQSLYEAEVPVGSQSEAARNPALARALAQVLGKLSGDASVSSRPGVAQELRRAAQYVERYDYRQDEGVSASGAPTFQTTLVARFDREAVEGLAAAMGLPVWPEPRPRPVLWLAIDDGSGPRLVALDQNTVVRPITQRAIQRGYRLGLPRGSAAEQAAVGAIWRGDTAAIARLSARYQPPMQLIGRLQRAGSGWRADWTFVDNGRVLSEWSSEDGDARRAMSAGADGAADALVARYAKVEPVGEPGQYRILFTGINSSDDFIRLSGTLQRMPVVRRVVPVRATADGVEFELELVTGLPGFRRLLDGEQLVEVESLVDTGVPIFRLAR